MIRAAIDIGTNTVLMLIGEREPDGEVRVIEDHARITRLGQGVAATKRLSEAAIERTLAVLSDYRRLAAQHGAEVEAVATEGLRMAENAEAFLAPAAAALGHEIRVISGDEEGALAYASVAQGAGDQELRVLDIGGGSTELVVGRGTVIVEQRSHLVGSVRLHERLIHRDPPSAVELQQVEQAAVQAFAAQPLSPHPVLHGIAGTVTSAAALLLGLEHYEREKVDGTSFSVAQIVGLRDQLAAEPVAMRVARPILGVGRGDVIVAGLTILVAAMGHCGATTLVVRDRGLRFALI